jgi:hypothetical protein
VDAHLGDRNPSARYAFDTFFTRGFGVSTFGQESLRKVGAFYGDHAEVIDSHREPTLDFDTGEPPNGATRGPR